jgi:anthranilate phosphoribosyltransferase
MRERVVRVEAPPGTIDVVGTGGDGSGTFNISTASALVVASTGVPVAKHGNRAITSRSGSADVLDALGIRIDHTAVSAAASLQQVGFAFLFAPSFHPAMRHAGPTRREIGIRTSFNLIGPLTNPAGARRALIGVGDAATAVRVAEVAALLGTDRTLVVHGDGIDELPLDGSGVVRDVGDGAARTVSVDVDELGLGRAPTAALAGGTADENAALIEAIFAGERGPRYDVVLLNSAAAFVAADVATDLADGIAAARNALETGMPRDLLARLRAQRTAAERDAAAQPAGEPDVAATRSPA